MELLTKPQLADPNELVNLCRDPRVKEIFKEAVASYQTGAFRSAIIMSWITLVFDYIYKLEELGLKGDRQAEQEVSDFFDWHEKNDTQKLLAFENCVLEKSFVTYQFINSNEKKS